MRHYASLVKSCGELAVRRVRPSSAAGAFAEGLSKEGSLRWHSSHCIATAASLRAALLPSLALRYGLSHQFMLTVAVKPQQSANDRFPASRQSMDVNFSEELENSMQGLGASVTA
eukprot:358287-Chlamydomonas_euryale.AAC.12